jgi:hypothetical protein
MTFALACRAGLAALALALAVPAAAPAAPAASQCLDATAANLPLRNRANGIRYEITAICWSPSVGGTKEYTTPTRALKGQFVQVTMRVENTSSQPLMWLPQNTILIDDDRNVYPFSTSAAAALMMEQTSNAPDMFSFTLQPGLVKTMVMPFDVPGSIRRFKFYLTEADAGKRSGGAAFELP